MPPAPEIVDRSPPNLQQLEPDDGEGAPDFRRGSECVELMLPGLHWSMTG